MEKITKITIIAIGFVCLFFASQIYSASAYDITTGGGLSTATVEAYKGKGAIPFTDLTLATLPGRVGVIIGSILAFLGLIFFVLVIYAGFLWMSARGNDTQIKDAQKIMKSAIIGLLIVLSAYIITAFVGRILA
jgi:hypothetical protein